MSKTTELVERHAIDELKSQVAEANTNPYFGIYGVLIGILIINSNNIISNLRESSQTSG